MTRAGALAWIDEVDGTLFLNESDEVESSRYVALIRTPAPSGHRGKIIVAFGPSLPEATRAAREQGYAVWRELSALH